MRMERLFLITQSICVSIVLGDALSGVNILFVHSPTILRLKPGENAAFTCNISALHSDPKDFNWYKMVKIADLNNVTDRRLNLTTNWKLREAKLHIVNVTFSDSGKYHCSYISENGQIFQSNESELFVNRNRIPQPQQQDPEKSPQDPSVYTINYGILEFGSRQPYRKSSELNVPEQVEYATIMFPPPTPSMGEKKGRSA
ncbi:programmed cell death protein 1 isoform X2 [Ranitomeya variabilis]|uniref:programmed cell death protein 1 isoform X2 n=1 Tax=Ranitomeya variabilis TaxID=490064 RepID=UPI0040565DC8